MSDAKAILTQLIIHLAQEAEAADNAFTRMELTNGIAVILANGAAAGIDWEDKKQQGKDLRKYFK